MLLIAALAFARSLSEDVTVVHISTYTLDLIRPLLTKRIDQISARMHEMLQDEPAIFQQEMAKAWVESLRMQRSSLKRWLRPWSLKLIPS